LPAINNVPSNEIICSGQSVGYIPDANLPGTQFVYSSQATGVITGNTDLGIGNISDVLVNNGDKPDSVIYIITPGTVAGCGGTPVIWTVVVYPASAGLTPEVDRNNFCFNDPGNIQLSELNAAGQPVEWYTGSCGGTLVGTGSPISISSPTTNTTYFVRYPGCSTCNSIAVSVIPLASSVVNANICSGDTYILPDGVAVSSPGFYPVTLTGPSGCDSVVNTTITVLPVYNSAVNAEICQGENYTLPGGSIVAASGLYPDTLTAVNGCDSIIVTNLTVHPLPVVVVNNEVICIGDDVLLNASGAVSYTWSPATGLSATSGSSVTANPVITITYTVIGIDANGCIDTATSTVTVNSLPTTTPIFHD
jgi:hypothetical protein